MEENTRLERLFSKFKAITKKNLTRKERLYYCTALEATLEYIKSDICSDNFIDEFLKIPSTDWELFFNKVNILDRNYRSKFKEVYSCYKLFKLGKKQEISELKKETTDDEKLTGKKFVKSLIKLLNSEKDDVLVDNIIGKDLSIKQLFKLYHLLNTYLDDDDYRKEILLNTAYNKLMGLFSRYAKKSEVKKHKYFNGTYPVDKYKDRISYLYLRHEKSDKWNYSNKIIMFDVKNGKIQNNKFCLSNNRQLECCTLFNCNISIYSTKDYEKLEINNVESTFTKGRFLVGFIEVSPESDNCSVSLKIKEKNILNISKSLCSVVSGPIHQDKPSIWFFIYNPVDEILLFGENMSTQILNNLNTMNCTRLIKKIKESKLSIEEIFDNENLNGELEVGNLCDIMNKNK